MNKRDRPSLYSKELLVYWSFLAIVPSTKEKPSANLLSRARKILEFKPKSPKTTHLLHLKLLFQSYQLLIMALIQMFKLTILSLTTQEAKKNNT